MNKVVSDFQQPFALRNSSTIFFVEKARKVVQIWISLLSIYFVGT